MATEHPDESKGHDASTPSAGGPAAPATEGGAPALPLDSLPIPLDTVQHILKYVAVEERGRVATGFSANRKTAETIGEQLVCSFFWGGECYPGSLQYLSAGSFLLSRPKFAQFRDVKDIVKQIVEHSGDALKYADPER